MPSSATLDRSSVAAASIGNLKEVELPSAPAPLPAQGPQYSATDTYSKHIVGASSFQMYYLYAKGLGGDIPYPWEVNPKNFGTTGSPYVINLTEPLELGVVIEFDHSPLTQLLMCLGTKVSIDFGMEGFGKNAAEADVVATITTVPNQFKYLVNTTIIPKAAGLTPGYYELAATATIGPSEHACGNFIFAYGYIGEIRFQLYQGPLPLQ